MRSLGSLRSLWGHCEVWWHHDKDSLEKVLMCNVQRRSHDAFNRTVRKLSVMNFIIEVFTGPLGSEEIQILLSVIRSALFLLPRVCMPTCLIRVDQLWSCGHNHRGRKRNVNMNCNVKRTDMRSKWKEASAAPVLPSSDKGTEIFFRKIGRL